MGRFLVAAVLAATALAQTRAPMRSGSPLGQGLPPVHPIPPLMTTPRPPQQGIRPAGFYSFPFYGGYAPVESPAMPAVTIVQQFPVVEVQPPPEPPPPAKSTVIEYKHSETTPAEPQAFTLVMKDGLNLSATAVFVQGSELHYVDSDGQHLTVPLASVDRAATKQKNLERNLRLQL